MTRTNLLTTTVAAAVLGGILFNSHPAAAQMAVIDVKAISEDIQSVEKETGMLDALNWMKTQMNSLNDAIGLPTYGTTNQLLQQGFTQNANYAKAQVGAWQQITDASNIAMSQFHLQVRQAQIRDEHTVSPNHCTALDGGVSTVAAAVQGYSVGLGIETIHDARGEAMPGMPAYYGQAQASQSMAQEHLANYCDQKDVDAGLCSAPSQTPDGDTQFASLMSSSTYQSQQAINQAKDYAVNLIEPVAPAALRGSQLSSIAGQDAAVRRRSYDARMSLAQSLVDLQIGMQTPSVPITPTQSQYLTNMGQPQPQTGNISWLQALQIEAERRASDVNWHSTLTQEPPAAVEKEIAQELALLNYIEFQNFKLGLQHLDVSATQLAETTDRDFQRTSQMPTPSIAANQTAP